MTTATLHDETDLNILFQQVRRYSVGQCEPLLSEDYVPQPVVFVSPPKWHLAHTTWFFEEFVLKPFDRNYRDFDQSFGYLFNSYYNTVGQRIMRTDRGNLTRPPTSKIYDYRKYVDEHLEVLLRSADEAVRETVILGLQHEQQHQELFYTDLKYIFGHQPLFPVYREDGNLSKAENLVGGFLHIGEGVYDIGYDGKGFCYDNELGRHQVFLHDFEISKALVTNDEYLEFMADGGYDKHELWLDEGWAWVQQQHKQAPLYWHLIDGQWHHYTLAGLKPVVPGELLCHVNFYEASAFAEWKGMRLPTEFEWEAASNQLSWGQRWEWSASAYLPYPGFAKPEGAVGEYNGKFMINQMTLRGASAATSPNHSRTSYRNFFHPQYQWQFSGIRLAKKQQV
jgi:ergothioneine biosynthesis protein EgtB